MSRPPKKSEMLEVRLSHEDKEALRRKAERNGMTLSAVARMLIADYLRENDATIAERPSLLGSVIMTFQTYPGRVAATLAAAAMAALAISMPAQAEERSYAVSFEVETPIREGETDGVRSRRSDMIFTIDDQGVICLPLDPQDECQPDGFFADGHSLVMFAKPDGDTVKISLQIKHGRDIIAEPWFTVATGETGSVEISHETDASLRVDVEALETVIKH